MAKDKSKKKADKATASTETSSVIDDELSDPAAGGSNGDEWKIADAAGELLVVKPSKHETGVATAYGEKDAIRATVIVVDEKKPAKSEIHTDVLIFGSALISSLKKSLGLTVVGRLEQGEAKAGQSKPWILTAADADEKDAARAALKALK